METTYINESEIRDNLVKECRVMNQRLIQALNKKRKRKWHWCLCWRVRTPHLS